MIDYNLISNTLVGITRDAVGDLLSRTGTVGDNRPSVIITRQGNTKPNEPYVVLDKLSTSSTKGWLTEYGLVDGTEIEQYVSEYTILYQFTVYGNNQELQIDAHDICQRLEAYYRFPSVLERLEKEAAINLEQTFEIVSAPQKLSAQRDLEVSYFTATFVVRDVLQDPSVGVIERLNISGDVYKSPEDETPLPQPIEINVP